MQINEEKIVVKMYVESKLSMVQIAEKLHISPSKVVRILERNGIQRRNMSDAITNIFITKFRKKPFHLKENLSSEDNNLKIAGIMLYWGEGAKTNGMVNFSNSNPDMIAVFLRFLREICGIAEKRMKALLHVYPDHNYCSLQNFWMEKTNIKKENFYRPFVHVGKVGTYKNKSVYGTLSISYADSKLLKLILSWIEEYKNTVLNIRPE